MTGHATTTSAADLLAQMRRIQHEHAMAMQWQIMVELLGSEDTAATVVERTPFMGVPRRAAEILKERDA